MSVVDTKMIKSAQRALEVLEFFDAEHTQATVMEIARSLGYPQSSTSELLRCLVRIGYLNYDRYRRTYEPTARVPLLGAWVQTGLFRRGQLLPVLDEISRATGETVTLSSVIGLGVQYIHVVPARGTGSPPVVQGASRPLLNSAAGRLFLAGYTEARVRELVRRLNADEPNPDKRVKLANLEVELKRIREQGYAVEYGEFETGFGAINTLLPHHSGQTMAIGIAGLSQSIQVNVTEYLAVIRAAVKRVARPPMREEMALVPMPMPVGEAAMYANRAYATA